MKARWKNRKQLPAQRMSHKIRARKHAEKGDTRRNKSRCTSGKAETQTHCKVECAQANKKGASKQEILGKGQITENACTIYINIQARCIGGMNLIFAGSLAWRAAGKRLPVPRIPSTRPSNRPLITHNISPKYQFSTGSSLLGTTNGGIQYFRGMELLKSIPFIRKRVLETIPIPLLRR